MENEFLQVLSRCPWVRNARLLKKPEQPETVDTVLNDMIAFNYTKDGDKSEIEPLILGYLDGLGFNRDRRPVRFSASGGKIEALFAGIFTDGNLRIRVSATWLEEENRLVAIHITQLVEDPQS